MGDVISFVVPTKSPTIESKTPAPFVKKVRTKKFCAHHSVSVDENAREVTCGDCEAHLDPIEALVTLARSSGDFVARLEHMKAERAELAAEIETLKKQRQNLKAAIRRAPASGQQVVSAETEPQTLK